MFYETTDRAAVDVYSRTWAALLFHRGLAAGERFAEEDLLEMSRRNAANSALGRVRGHLQKLLREGRLSQAELMGLVVRVHGTIEQLEDVFDCQVSASKREVNEPVFEQVGHQEFGAAWSQATSEFKAKEVLGSSEQQIGPVEEPWEPVPPVELVPHFETEPSLPGCEQWVTAIEPAGRWPIRAEHPEIVCELIGHREDIIFMSGPSALFECMCCGERSGS